MLIVTSAFDGLEERVGANIHAFLEYSSGALSDEHVEVVANTSSSKKWFLLSNLDLIARRRKEKTIVMWGVL